MSHVGYNGALCPLGGCVHWIWGLCLLGFWVFLNVEDYMLFVTWMLIGFVA